MLSHMAQRLYDKDMSDEIKSLVVRNDRIDHPEGCHDDLCIGLLLVGFFVFYGKNHYMYGIPDGEILKETAADGRKVDPNEKTHQLDIRNRLNELKTLIPNTQNSSIKAWYEREKRELEYQVDDTVLEKDTVSVEQVRSSNHPTTEAIFNKFKNYQDVWF